MKLKKHRLKLLVQSVLSAVILFFPSFVLSQTPFYQGKTITVIQGTEAGGSSDVMTRAMLPYLKKHIPGQPTIVLYPSTCRAEGESRPPTTSIKTSAPTA